MQNKNDQKASQTVNETIEITVFASPPVCQPQISCQPPGAHLAHVRPEFWVLGQALEAAIHQQEYLRAWPRLEEIGWPVSDWRHSEEDPLDARPRLEMG